MFNERKWRYFSIWKDGYKMKGNKKIFSYTKKCDVKWKEMKRYLRGCWMKGNYKIFKYMKGWDVKWKEIKRCIWNDGMLNERKLKDI